MAQVDASGITPQDLTGWQARLEEQIKAVLGQDIALDPETPQGQIIGISALANAEADEALVAASNARSVDFSAGIQQDNLYSLLHVARQHATHTTVTLLITGVTNTFVPLGTVFATVDDVEFRTTEGAPIGTNGNVSIAAEAVRPGAVEAPANSITRIVNSIAGLETVTNPLPGVIGKEQETDYAYRTRYRRITGRLSNGPLDALRAALWETDGVTAVRVEENPSITAITRQGIELPRYSILCIVQGGSDTDIAAAIMRAKGMGVPTAGDTASGDARFQRVQQVSLRVSLSTLTGMLFPASGIDLIKQRLENWFSGGFSSLPGQFETEGIGIGETVDEKRLLSPVNSVPGHSVDTLTVSINPADLVALIDEISLHTADPEDSNELSGNGYERAEFDATQWELDADQSNLENIAAVGGFGTRSGTPVMVTHFALHARGKKCGQGALTSAFNWTPGTTVSLVTGALDAVMDYSLFDHRTDSDQVTLDLLYTLEADSVSVMTI